MPVLTSLSLLSTTVSGLIQAAGHVADALESAKSGSVKKADSPKQTLDAGQLANLFAAYLAAAAHTTPSPAATSTPSSNVAQKGPAKSVKEVSASLLPLSVVLALGPTTAITASLALHSAPVGGTASSKTAQTLALVSGATSTVPTSANAPHPAAKQTSAPVTKTFSPSKGTQNVPIASVSDRNGSIPAKGAQNGLVGGPQTSVSSPRSVTPPAQGVLPASHQATTAEVPVLALHDVPVPTPQDDSQTVAVPKASVSGTREASTGGTSSLQPAEIAHAPVEVPPVPKASPIVPVAQMKFVGWAESPRPTSGRAVGLEDSAHPTKNTSGTDSGPQTVSPQSASNTIVTAAGSVGQISGNTTPVGSNNSQTNPPVAEQLSRAFVAQASVVNHEGRTDFHLRLEPPQLGSVQIHLTATHDKVSARVIVAQEDTRQLIVGQAHQLRQSLAESGLLLGAFEVTRDGGGPSQGGYRQPPDPPQPPATGRASPTVSTVANTPLSVPTDGIDILA